MKDEKEEEPTQDSAVAVPPVPTAKVPSCSVSIQKVLFGLAACAIMGFFLYDMMDLSVVSEVDGEPIRYRTIAVSLVEASDIVQKLGKNYLSQEKKIEMERQKLEYEEGKLLRTHLVLAGDSEHVSWGEQQLSEWGRYVGRIKRSKKMDGELGFRAWRPADRSGEPPVDDNWRALLKLGDEIKEFLISTDEIVDVDVNIGVPESVDTVSEMLSMTASISILEFTDSAGIGKNKLAQYVRQISKMLGGIPTENIYVLDKDGKPLFEEKPLYGWERFKHLCDTGLKEYAHSDYSDSRILKQLSLDGVDFEQASPPVYGKIFYFSDGDFIKENSLDFRTLKLDHFKMGIRADLFGDTEEEYILALCVTSPTGGFLYIYDCCLRRICFFESGCVSSIQVWPGRNGKDILEIVTKARTGNAQPIHIQKTQYSSNRLLGDTVPGCDQLFAKMIEEKLDCNTPGVSGAWCD